MKSTEELDEIERRLRVGNIGYGTPKLMQDAANAIEGLRATKQFSHEDYMKLFWHVDGVQEGPQRDQLMDLMDKLHLQLFGSTNDDCYKDDEGSGKSG